MKDLSSLPDAHLRIFDRPAPPDPADIRDIHLIGICGTGMGSLAGLLQQAGYQVRGSDEAAYPPMSVRLAEMGIEVIEGFDPANLEPAPDLIIVGNSCTPRHPEASYAREQGLPQLSFPEALHHFFLRDRRSVVVAGTHGKTTTTGLLAHVLRWNDLQPGFMVGGVMRNHNVSYDVGQPPYFVVEGDEYDSAYFDKQPKMMHYAPHSAIITSMEFDHADIYDDWDDYREAFRRFAAIVPPEGMLALNSDHEEVRELSRHTQARVRYFGTTDEADVTARNVRAGSGGQRFDLIVDGAKAAEVFFPMNGHHNLLNVLAVCTIALDEGVDPEGLAEGIAYFRGMKRRQEIRGEASGVLIIDDFAHHPTAVRETVRAIAERWPERRVVAVFEPRSNSSRRKIFESAYAESFYGAASVFLSSPPLRHNDRADDLLDPLRVVDRLERSGISASTHVNADAMLPGLLTAVKPGDVVLIMSNGGFGNIQARLLEALEDRERSLGMPVR